MDLILTVGAFFTCLALCSRWAPAGIGFALGAGCFYGIIRANYPGVVGYFFFDASLIGTYLGCLVNRPFMNRPTPREMTRWLIPMLIWPFLLVWLDDNLLVSLVGLRAAVFFPIFVLLGMRLTSRELLVVGRFVMLAVFVVTVFAALETTRGVLPFYPQNEVTSIIYNSSDVKVEGKNYLRIPATFAHAAVYAGTMVIFIPLMIHGIERDHFFLKMFFAAGLLCCVLGVFISATRTSVVVMLVVAIYVTVRNPTVLFSRYVLPVILLVGITAYAFVDSNPRLHRFKSIGGEGVIVDRFQDSNAGLSLVDMAVDYPMGGGLTFTGVSLPRFIKKNSPSVVTENEYARIIGTQGIPGLILVLGFFLKCLVVGLRRHPGLSVITSDVVTGILAVTLASGFTGVGSFAAVPSAAALFLILGFQATAVRSMRTA